jgi:hypothetical protein
MNDHRLTIGDFKDRSLNHRGKVLLYEWERIDELCNQNREIEYIVRKRSHEDIPVEYEIIYKIRSIIGVKEPTEVYVEVNGEKFRRMIREPLYGDEHRMRIMVPNNFPGGCGTPSYSFISNVWHPQIKFGGPMKGRVYLCNSRDTGAMNLFVDRIQHIWQYLQYKIYFVLDEYPYPEDLNVAQWVLEEAEPMGWIDKEKGVYTDNKDLKRLCKSHITNNVISNDQQKHPQKII